MQEIFEALNNYDLWVAFLATVFTLATAILSIITNKFSKIRKKELEKLLNIVIEDEQKQKEVIDEIIHNIPKGLSDDEYYTKLRKVISKTSLGNLKKTTNDSFDDSIDTLISNHHEQALRQSSIQFWFSLIASIIGFILIILMIVMSENTKWYEYIIKILPGAIIEAVSVLFFSQSKETRERSSDFLNRLREYKQYTKSIIIANSIDDEKLRATVKAKIALHMSGIHETNIV